MQLIITLILIGYVENMLFLDISLYGQWRRNLYTDIYGGTG